jgi:hypothetical protein
MLQRRQDDGIILGSVADPDPFLNVPRSGSVPECSRIRIRKLLNEHNKINWKGKLTKYAFLLGPPGHTDKENQFNMYKKYCFSYITYLRWQGSGSV